MDVRAFDEFFREATGVPPFPFQRRLALDPDLPALLVAPTGAGKTAALTLAWLWRRRFAAPTVRKASPRRMVWCLPMRTLVVQTEGEIKRWLKRIHLLDEGQGLDREGGVGVHVLMGGRSDDDWHRHPERDAIVIGTQDMLLSRALNRGFGCSRYMWPWHFALLSNDVLWVFDEVQLMGVGLATGLQLSAFRRSMGGYGPSHSIFVSATADPDWLVTVDHREAPSPVMLSSDDLKSEVLQTRRRAVKRLARARTVVEKGFEKDLAEEVLRRHHADARTIVVLNTVEAATALYDALKAKAVGVRLVLLHSRFRPPDRAARVNEAIDNSFHGIVISTQVIEAGVDVSSRVLFTQLAPWASLVQRAGRCNRKGEYSEADVIWIDFPEEIDEKVALPYEREDLLLARRELMKLASFNPDGIEAAGVALAAPEFPHVLRRQDLVDLFDTTPDLAGFELDVSRFIREGDERDVQVFWRTAPTERESQPARDELCPVPFLRLREWIKKGARPLRFDSIDGTWSTTVHPGNSQTEVFPGRTFLVDSSAGGYNEDRGFDPSSSAPVPIVPEPERARTVSSSPTLRDEEHEGAFGDDPLSQLNGWVPLLTHSLDTRRAAREIVDSLSDLALPADVIVESAHAHDLGKAHPVFQETMRKGREDQDPAKLWAKSGQRSRHSRTGFRHELASALAVLQAREGPDTDLIAYLVAAHHGKVRLSIRAQPNDGHDADLRVQGKMCARGIFDADSLPKVDLGEGLQFPPLELSLSPMMMGRQRESPSWSERVLALRDTYHPFRLTFLEMLVRAADVRASMREERLGRQAPGSP